MKAVDTNVLARLILADDGDQAARVAELLAEPVWVAVTVWLELGWVLEKRTGLNRGAAAGAIETLLLLDKVNTADRSGLRWAVERYRGGADWADMVHLVSVRTVADTFVTFDRGIARNVGDDGPVVIETLA